MNANSVCAWYATMGPLGYFPASGTVATFITVCALGLLPHSSSSHYFLLIGLLYLAAYWCIKKILNTIHEEDPSEIVIDEVIGSLVTFCFIPLTPLNLIVGFTLFRFFDICKWGPVGTLEKLPGATGILMDDVMAGLISNIVLHIFVLYVVPQF